MAVPPFVPSPRGPFMFFTHVPHGYSSRESSCWQAELYASVHPKDLKSISILSSVQGSWQRYLPVFPVLSLVLGFWPNSDLSRDPAVGWMALIMGMYPEETDPYEFTIYLPAHTLPW